MKYYELCYFYSRKDSGSVYIKTELDLEDYHDDEFLDELVQHGEIEYDIAVQTVEINEITEDEYTSFT